MEDKIVQFLREVSVARSIVFFITLTVALILGLVPASAQEKSYIVVTGSEVNSGVVILHIQRAEKSSHLECNQGAAACMKLNNARYQMLELPENYGMYECKDVEVYAESPSLPDKSVPDRDKKLGEYCLVEK